MVLPAWLEQNTEADFGPEKQMLTEIEQWAERDGWTVSDGRQLPYELRARTDVLLEKPAQDKRVRLAVLMKSPKGKGEIRLDSSDFVTLELIHHYKERQWSAEVGNVILKDVVDPQDISWLFGKLFRG